jgi:ABC-2 type transport system ATP-binding protein
MTDAIETEGLTKDFPVGFWRPRPYRALDHLTLTVTAGEVFGFLGPNGAGKSTALKLLMQLIYPTSGEARILGRPVGDLAVRRRIGFLAENPYYYDYLTAEELLSYFARLFGYRGAEVGTRVTRVLDEVGLGAERRMRLRRFSKGMIQRVGLAQALINDPEIVFLDEPMSGLDPLGRRHVRDLILGLRAKGCTVFFSSHILPDAETLCSRVGVLVQGRLVASGPLSEILAFELKGWELVLAGVTAALRNELDRTASRVTLLSDGHVMLHLPPDTEPDRVLTDVTRRGATVVSLNPVRETLEDYFVQVVGAAAPRDQGGL